ncbi:MAG: Txe/YoeB family addiction module toxin [Bacteroidota bacterium]
MKKLWHQSAWEDYLFWQKTDKKILKRINALIKSCERTPFSGIGKPEPLKNELSSYWSRRIDQSHRLVYKIENDTLTIIQCRFHY